MRGMLCTLDRIFRPLLPGKPFRQEPTLEKKLAKGDAAWSTRKTILGWVIDTVNGTLELPDHRFDRLCQLLDNIPPTQQRVGVRAWQKVLGELRSMSLAIPGSRGLFSMLQHALRYNHTGRPHRVQLTAAVHTFLHDFRQLATALHTTRPTRIAELVARQPTVLGATDALVQGMGGVAFVHLAHGSVSPIVWRAPFAPKTQACLISWENPRGTITNSDLELAATIVHHDVLARYIDLAEHTIQSLHDNTPGVYWQRKGSVTTTEGLAAFLR